MKKILTTALLCFAFFSYAQKQPNQTSINGSFDKVFDRYGKEYNLEDLRITKKDGSGTPKNLLLCSTGYFDVYFEAGSGMEGGSLTEAARRNVLCQVFSDLSQFIATPIPTVKVNILVRNINPFLQGYNANSNPNPAASSSVMGLATGFYVVPTGAPTYGGIVDNEIWKTINSGVDSYTDVAAPLASTAPTSSNGNFYHGMVAFNFNNPGLINWHTALNQLAPSSLCDLYTVALHEITHALGFASLIDVTGNSKFGTGFKYYSRYDRFLKTSTNDSLITNTGSCSMYGFGFNPSLNTSVMVPSPFNCSTQIKFAGSVNQSVYTPSTFDNGSSLSHLEDLCHVPTNYADDSYYVMSNGNGPGNTKRFLKPEERNVLCDIGYQVSSTYGNTTNLNFKDYGSACSGLQVVGINDGIDASGGFQHVVSVGIPQLISGITSNDFNTASFECLQDVYSNGTLSNTSGTSFTYTATTPGVTLLRYIPVSPTGNRGNITYIYVYVKSGNCTPSSGSCNLLNNAGFESNSICGQMGSSSVEITIDCWMPYNETPDFFVRNCNNPSSSYWSTIYNVPTPWSSPASDSWNGAPNNHFLGIGSIGSATNSDYESVQSQMNAPLIPGHTYTLSFRAKAGNNTNTTTSPDGGEITFGGSPSVLATTYSTYNPSTLPSGLTVTGTPIFITNDNTWNLYTQTFTYNGTANLNNFIFLNSSCRNASLNYPDSYVYFDDVNLVEETFDSLSLPSVLCINQSIADLSLYAPVPGGTFSGPGVSLSGGIYSFNASAVGSGTYQLSYTYTDNNGCLKTIIDEIEVVHTAISASASASPMTVCNGQTVTLTGTCTGATSFLWNPGNLSGSTVNTVVNATTMYTLTATNPQGCVATATVTVNSSSFNTAVSPASSSICSGQSVVLTASGGTTYVWSPASGLSSTTGTSVTATPTTTTTYTVTGTTGSCTNSTTTTITVNPSCADCTSGTLLSGVISASPTTGAALRIANNVSISGNVNFTNNNVKIMPGVTITVNGTSTLTISGSHFYGCENMWQGIKVQPGGKVIVQPYTVSGVIQKTPLIEDAVVGIDFLPLTAQQASALLQVDNAIFNKNETSIRIQGYPFANAGSMFIIKNSLFTSRTIYNTSTPTVWPLTSSVKAANGNTNQYLSPYIASSYAVSNLKAPQSATFSDKGIHLINVGTTTGSYIYNSMTIGSSVAAEYTVFDYLKVGIYADRTNFSLINSTIQFPKDITDAMYNAQSMPYIGTGIYATGNSGGRYRADIAGSASLPNKFYCLTRALHSNRYNDIQFVYNTIRSNRPQTAVVGGSNGGKVGVYIFLDRRDNVVIANNTVYNIDKGVYLNTTADVDMVPTIRVNTNTFQKDLSPTNGAISTDAIWLESLSLNSQAGGAIYVNDNAIDGANKGVTLKNWKFTTIQVKTNKIGLNAFLSAPVSYGIELNGCSSGSTRAQINYNKVTGFSQTSAAYKGISFVSSTGNDLTCNSVTNTHSGLYFSGNCNPTKTYNNTMENHRYGFVLDNGGVIGLQGSSGSPTDNRWQGTNWDATGTVNGNFKTAALNTSDASSSIMYIRTGSTTNPDGSATNFPGNMAYSFSILTLLTTTGPDLACGVDSDPGDPDGLSQAHGNEMVSGADELFQLSVETHAEDKYSTYPVPNDGKFYLTGHMNEGDKVSVLSADGKLVYEQLIGEISEKLTVDTKLSRGTYTVILKNAQGIEMFRERIIIML